MPADSGSHQRKESRKGISGNYSGSHQRKAIIDKEIVAMLQQDSGDDAEDSDNGPIHNAMDINT